VLMITYSVDNQTAAPVISRAAELNKGVLIKKGFGSGKLPAGEQSLEETVRPIFARAGISSLVAGTLNPKHLLANAAAVAAVVRNSDNERGAPEGPA
jgi:hypothetical protein